MSLLTAGGVSPVKGTQTQVRDALYALLGRLASANTWSAVNVFNGATGDTNAALQTLESVTNRKKLWEAVASNGSPVVYIRLYATADKSFELTCNANWDGTQWVPDTTGLASSKFRVTTAGMHYFSAAGGPANFTNAALEAIKVDLVPGNFTKGNVLGVSTTGTLTMAGPAAGVYAHEAITAVVGLTTGIAKAGHRRLSFFKDAFGVVHIEGNVDGDAAASSGDTIFVLPAGYRPAASAFFHINDAGGFVPLLAEIQADGDVVVTQSGGGLLPFHMCFDGITFHPSVTVAP